MAIITTLAKNLKKGDDIRKPNGSCYYVKHVEHKGSTRVDVTTYAGPVFAFRADDEVQTVGTTYGTMAYGYKS